jgi:hypothetical protein
VIEFSYLPTVGENVLRRLSNEFQDKRTCRTLWDSYGYRFGNPGVQIPESRREYVDAVCTNPWSPCYYTTGIPYQPDRPKWDISEYEGVAYSTRLTPYRNAAAASYCRHSGRVFPQLGAFEGVLPYQYRRCDDLENGLAPIQRYSFLCGVTSSPGWSPCYRDEDAEAMGLGNSRDDAARQWCVSKGYSGLSGEWRDCGDWYFSLRCAPRWSPCYRDEQAREQGLANRDALGDKWCRDNGFGGKDGGWRDCGNWYFSFRCLN